MNSSSQQNDPFSALSNLEDGLRVAGAILEALGDLFLDYDPEILDGGTVRFTLFSALSRGVTGEAEIDQHVRKAWRKIENSSGKKLNRQHHAEIIISELRRISEYLVLCRSRSDTQVFGRNHFELLVRDDTPDSIQNPDFRRASHPLDVTQNFGETRLHFIVGTPGSELLLRCAIRRVGLDPLAMFDLDRLINCLVEIEKSPDAHSDHRQKLLVFELLQKMTKPELLSLRVEADCDMPLEELEAWATAFRARIAFEASKLYTPVYDVQNLFRTRPAWALGASASPQAERATLPVLSGYFCTARV